MDLERLIRHFETSAAVRLLRAKHAPFVVRFLHEQFKRGERIAIPHSELVSSLSAFQEQIRELHPEALRDRAEAYLSDWSSREKLWLKRVIEAGQAETLYQLTPATEEVIEFLSRTLDRPYGFVGTESRLQHVVDTLENVVVGASDDPAVHLEHLTDELQRIQDEIDRIEKGEQSAGWTPTRVREQFALAVSLLQELQRDFRSVEERFKQITHDVQLQHGQGSDSRGGILKGALDAVDGLRTDDQGVSFYAFFRFIQSPEQQDRLRRIVSQLEQIDELAEQTAGLNAVRRMMPLLLAEATKVTRTERRLSTTLRRLLDAQGHRERQRVTQLLMEIRTIAARMADRPPQDRTFLEVDESLQISSPARQTFWNAPSRFETIDLTESTADANQNRQLFEGFARMHRIDFKAMRTNIRNAVSTTGSIKLRDFLEVNPPSAGVIDVLGYLQIASDDGHVISDEGSEEIVIPSTEDRPALAVTVPIVTFVDRGRH